MDTISDLIINIKNASAVGKETTTVPYSKLKESILEVLSAEGFIAPFKKAKKDARTLEIGLVYDEYGPRVKGVERVSKLSKRLYSDVKSLKPVKNGHGLMILTTPKGIMTDAQARKANVGGELLFKIW